MFAKRALLTHIVKVSSSTIEIYTHTGNREISKAKNPLNSLHMKRWKIISLLISLNWEDRHKGV